METEISLCSLSGTHSHVFHISTRKSIVRLFVVNDSLLSYQFIIQSNQCSIQPYDRKKRFHCFTWNFLFYSQFELAADNRNEHRFCSSKTAISRHTWVHLLKSLCVRAKSDNKKSTHGLDHLSGHEHNRRLFSIWLSFAFQTKIPITITRITKLCYHFSFRLTPDSIIIILRRIIAPRKHLFLRRKTTPPA